MKEVKKVLAGLALLAVLALFCAFLPMEANAETEGYYTYEVSNGEATITDVDTSISGAITIPSTLGGYPVTSIGDYAFWHCTGLTSVTIGSGVTSIGSSAFSGCTGLITVNFNATNCTSMGRSSYPVFEGCTNLKTVNIGENVKTIPDYAFEDCTGLTEITIPDSVISIGSSVFSGCSSLESIAIPFVGYTRYSDVYIYPFGDLFGEESYEGSVKVLQSNYHDSYGTSLFPNIAYYLPASLKHVTVTGGTILCGAFYNCSGLTSITIGEGVTEIGFEACYNCVNLQNINIPDSVNYIGENAFYGCTNLTYQTYNNGKYLGNLEHPYLFLMACTSDTVSSIAIHSTTKFIGDSAFSGYTGATEITIPDSVVGIGGYAFANCSSLTELIIPKSVTYVGRSAFAGCTALKSMIIPHNVTRIGNSVFSGCSNLETISIPYVTFSRWEAYTPYEFPLGDLFGQTSYKGSVAIEQPCNYSSYTHYITYYIPESLKNVTVTGGGISQNAFANFTGLDSVTISDSVTSIGESAFYNCTGLTSIAIPDSVKSIGADAFDGCSNLTDVYITDPGTWCRVYFENEKSSPMYYAENLNILDAVGNAAAVTEVALDNTVTQISAYAFAGCGSLKNITIPNSVTSIGGSAFAYCTGLTSITISSGVTSIGSSAFSGCTGLTSVTIGRGVTSIGSSAFSRCTGLTEITIPDSVTSIGNSAFKDCTGLTKITIPDSVTSIGSSAFEGCTGLKSITIPDSVTTIGEGVFYGCTGLTNVTIGSGVTTIGEEAFYNCTGLTSVTIGDRVTSIGEDAFYGCSGLTSITIPDGVTSIGEDAFYRCSGLTSIVIPQSVTNIGDFAFSTWTSTHILYTGSEKKWDQIYKNDEYMPSKSKITFKYVEGTPYHTYDDRNDDHCNICNKFRLIGCVGEGLGVEITTNMDKGYALTGDGSEFATVGFIGQSSIIIGSSGTYKMNYSLTFSKTGIFELVFVQEETGNRAIFTAEIMEHNYEFTQKVQPTCAQDGYDIYKCQYCEVTEQRNKVSGRSEHTWDNGTVTKQATCKEKGVKTYTCSVCGGTKTEDVVKLTTHTWDGGRVTKDATCKEEGVKTFTCFVCGDAKTEVIAKLATHTYGNWVKIDDTNHKHSCSICGKEETANHIRGNNGACTGCGMQMYIPGDVDGNETITDADAVYLLYYTFLPDAYPVNQDCDFNGDGVVTDQDAVYLLYYTFLPDQYPIS